MGQPHETLPPATQRAPNIIVILVDDLGINDVTMHGGGRGAEGVPTPNIDAIAKAGVRFDQAYAGSAVCTVSRAALLTGRYPWRFGVEFTPTPGAMARVAGSLYADPTKPHPISVDHAKANATPSFDQVGHAHLRTEQLQRYSKNVDTTTFTLANGTWAVRQKCGPTTKALTKACSWKVVCIYL
jgi:hypothetical protein